MKKILNLIIAGIGGQGNIMASRIIGDAAIETGYHVLTGETIGAGQRGGSVLSHVRILETRDYGPLIPAGEADIVIGLEPFESLKSAVEFLKSNGTVVTNIHPLMPPDKNYPSVEYIVRSLNKISGKVYSIDSINVARESGDIAASNIVMIGAAYASGVLPVKKENLIKAIQDRLGPAATINLKAFENGQKSLIERWNQ